MSAQFFGRSGKVLYGAFSIVGMAYQSQNVNNGIPDDRFARSIFPQAIIPSQEYDSMAFEQVFARAIEAGPFPILDIFYILGYKHCKITK